MQYLILIFVVVVGILGFDNYSVRNKNAELNTKLGTYKTQVDQLQGNVVNLKSQIFDNNLKIDQLVNLADARAKKAKEAIDAAAIASQTNVKLSNFLLLSKPNQADICKATDDLFNLYLDKRKANNEVPANR